MRSTRICVALAVFGLFVSSSVLALPISAKADGEQIAVSVAGKLFTAYKFAPAQKYPYFWPVNGPASGESVTTETSEPYPHHHSLFFGCDRVNGGNYWQDTNERGQIVSQGPKIVEAEGERVVFTDECLWRQPGQEPIIRDTRRVTISAPDEGHRLIDFEISVDPLVDVNIEKTNHSLFSARMTPALSVAQGGTLVNAGGATAEKGTYGVESPWCDYFGARNGAVEGLAIFQNPANRWYPAQWFTRDYGFFSPTPMYWIDGVMRLPKSEKLVLKYRVVVHSGDVKAADIEGLFREYRR